MVRYGPTVPQSGSNTEFKQVFLVMVLFYDGAEPPAGLYDELLNLTYTTKSIVRGTFIDFVSKQSVPTCKR